MEPPCPPLSPNHPPRRRSSRLNKGSNNEGNDATKENFPKQIENSEGQKPPSEFDASYAGSRSHFRHIDGDELSSDDEKPSTTKDSSSSTTTTTKDNGILSLFEDTLDNDKPLFTAVQPQQPTPKEIRAAKFPDHRTVEKAKEERPDLVERIGRPYMDEPINCAVFETVADSHLGCCRLLDAFPCIKGNTEKNNGKPIESSLYAALQITWGNGFDYTKKALVKQNLVLEKLDSYGDYIDMKEKTTPQSRERLLEIGKKWATKKGDWRTPGDSTSYQSNAVLPSTSNREAYQILVVREWHHEKMRKGGKILAKYKKVDALKSDVGGSWTIAGYSTSNKTATYKGGFPTLLAGAGGVIWKSVFFIELQQLNEETFDDEYARIDVDSDKFQQLLDLFSHRERCKKDCTCPLKSMYQPYMHMDKHQDLMDLLSEGE